MTQIAYAHRRFYALKGLNTVTQGNALCITPLLIHHTLKGFNMLSFLLYIALSVVKQENGITQYFSTKQEFYDYLRANYGVKIGE